MKHAVLLQRQVTCFAHDHKAAVQAQGLDQRLGASSLVRLVARQAQRRGSEMQ